MEFAGLNTLSGISPYLRLSVTKAFYHCLGPGDPRAFLCFPLLLLKNSLYFYVNGTCMKPRKLLFSAVLLFCSSVGRAQHLIYTIAGPNTQIPLSTVMDLEMDKSGNLYYCEWGSGFIKRISAQNSTVSFFSNGYTYTDITLDSNENIFAANYNSEWIKQIDFDDQTFMGNIWSTNVWLQHWDEVTVDNHGNLYAVSINNGPMWRRDAQTLAVQSIGTGRLPTKDLLGNVYFVDSNKLKKIDQVTQQISVIAGTGNVGPAGDGGPAINADFTAMYAIAPDPFGNIFVYESERIRKIDLNGIITTYAGVIGGGLTSEGVPALSASLSSTSGGRAMAIDFYGNLYYTSDMSTIRKIMGDAPAVTQKSANFSISVYNQCNTTNFVATNPVYNSNYSIKTYYGDGNTSSQALYSNNGTGYLLFNHAFPLSGRYKLKHVLLNSGASIDSIEYEHDYDLCKSISIQYYYDEDSNCVYDSQVEEAIGQPILIQVDSNSIAIDTLSCISGFTYNAYGDPGDTYTFNVINMPADLQSGCPPQISMVSSPIYTNAYQFGLQCNGSTGFDLGINTHQRCRPISSTTDIIVNKSYCNSVNSQLTMTFSSKYVFSGSSPAPTSQSGNTITWDLTPSSFRHNFLHIAVDLDDNGQMLAIGDTVQTTFSIIPTTGDINTANNIIIRCDTVRGPSDPNAVYVSPEGCVEGNTELEYTVTFENMGNDTAHNIYVMDTISAGVDMSSFRIITSSHLMNVTKVKNGGYYILKFDFPDIKLPDSSSPARHGFVSYTVKTASDWSNGSIVTNKAGIYFDYMPAVLTNVAETENCIPVSTGNVSKQSAGIVLYPNPATNELTIQTTKQYSSFTITNSIGQTMMNGELNNKASTLNIKSLPPGLYYISLEGKSGVETRRFVKI